VVRFGQIWLDWAKLRENFGKNDLDLGKVDYILGQNQDLASQKNSQSPTAMKPMSQYESISKQFLVISKFSRLHNRKN